MLIKIAEASVRELINIAEIIEDMEEDSNVEAH